MKFNSIRLLGLLSCTYAALGVFVSGSPLSLVDETETELCIPWFTWGYKYGLVQLVLQACLGEPCTA